MITALFARTFLFVVPIIYVMECAAFFLSLLAFMMAAIDENSRDSENDTGYSKMFSLLKYNTLVHFSLRLVFHPWNIQK